MTNPISGVGNLPQMPLPVPGLNDNQLPAGKTSFQSLLLDSLVQTGASEKAAQSAVETALSGGDITQVEVFSSMKKADLSLRMMLQIRNKILEAYNEIKDLRM